MKDVTVVEVPQWRGSGAATAERLVEGARLLAGMVPAGRRVRVEAADDLVVTASRVREALAAVDGMVLRALVGEGPRGLTADPVVDPRRVVLAGVRDLDPAEAAFIAEAGVGHVRTADPEALVRAVTAAGRQTPDSSGGSASGSPGTRRRQEATDRDGGDVVVYVHVDLDVLEPEVFGSVGTPAPGGFLPEELVRMVTVLGERFEVAGLGITEYEPGRPEDQELLAPVVKALAEACAGQPGRTAPR